MENKYRIVRDGYLGYEAQIKYWKFPFMWFQLYGVNTSRTVEIAKSIISEHKKGSIKRQPTNVVWTSTKKDPVSEIKELL